MEVIDSTVVGIALLSKVAIPVLVSDTCTTPSIFASNLSSWACVNDKAPPSVIWKVNAGGKLFKDSP